MTHDRTSNQNNEAEAKARNGADRAEWYRERFRHAPAIAAQKARMEAVGGQPSEKGTAHMVTEFHARGGQVTVCPPADATLKIAQEDRRRRG